MAKSRHGTERKLDGQALVSTGKTVHALSLERIRWAYQTYDHVVVSTSGGKDSTVVLGLAIEAAELEGTGPVEALFIDDEVVAPDVVSHVERIHARDDVRLAWWACPMRDNNVAMRSGWYPWAPEARELWVRTPPPYALTTPPGGLPADPPEARAGLVSVAAAALREGRRGSVLGLTGIRLEESPQRRLINRGIGPDVWIKRRNVAGGVHNGKPILEWTTRDVWTYIAREGLDYAKVYDTMQRAGMAPARQRVGPILAAEALGSLPTARLLVPPEWWDKIEQRVEGLRTATLYGDSPLFARANRREASIDKPDHLTYRQYLHLLLSRYTDPVSRKREAEHAERMIRDHYRWTREPILPTAPHPDTNITWKALLGLAASSDPADRRMVAIRSRGKSLRMGNDPKAQERMRAAYNEELELWRDRLSELA